MKKPVIVLLVDYPHWAFDYVAKSLSRRLRHKYDFRIKYVGLQDRLDPAEADLIHVFFWGETYHRKFGFAKEQVIKEVASLRWLHEERYGNLSSAAFARTHLHDCSCVVTPSRAIAALLEGEVEDLFHTPNGVETGFFRPPRHGRTGSRLAIGWVGNPDDSSKGVHDILIPAAAGFDFHLTDGRMTRRQLREFYRGIDVLAIGSVAESQPLPLLESMAAGCFPVATEVGIVPEVVRDKVNGLVVERSVAAFRDAFVWCSENLTTVRSIGMGNRVVAMARGWDHCASRFDEIYSYACRKKGGGLIESPGIACVLPDGTTSPDGSAAAAGIDDLRLLCSDWLSRSWYGDRYRRGIGVRGRKVLASLLANDAGRGAP